MYATSCSNSIAGKANRKTIQGQDVVSAMEDMEFDKFIKPLETGLQGKNNQNIPETVGGDKKQFYFVFIIFLSYFIYELLI